MCAKIKSVPTSTGHKYRPKGVSTREFHKVHFPFIPVFWAVLSGGAALAGAAEFGMIGALVGSASMTLATIIVIL